MQKTIVRELKVHSTFVIEFRVFNITVGIGIKLVLSFAPRLTFSLRQGLPGVYYTYTQLVMLTHNSPLWG